MDEAERVWLAGEGRRVRGRLICVRHGESEGNAARVFTINPHVPLTQAGAEQAREAGETIRARFAPVRVLSSPYRRALQTAEIIAGLLGIAVEIENDLREQFMGELHGRPYESALASPGWNERPRWQWRPPGGETLVEVQARALPVALRLARQHPDAHVVLVAHGGTIHSLWAHGAGAWERARGVPNAGLLVLPHDGTRIGSPELIRSGDGRSPDAEPSG